jgi:hypothetical protein
MSLKKNKLLTYFLAFAVIFCLLHVVLYEYQSAHNTNKKASQQETKTAVSDRLDAFVVKVKPSNAGLLIDDQRLKTSLMLANQNIYRTRVDIHKAVQQAVTGSLENLPIWLQDYVIWHNQARSTLTAENYSSHRFLIMKCLECDDRCGGTADRLVPIPLMLFVAHQTKWLLLIYWERPVPLEEFLSPTLLDWRLPSFLQSQMHCNDTSVLGTVDLIVEHAQSEERIVSTRCQSANYGAQYYNEQRMLRNASETPFNFIFRDVWRSVFQPSPIIRSLVEDALEKLHLFPNEYAAAHLRGLYGQHNRSQRVLDAWTRSAVNCASQIRPGGPIYFASDAAYATQTAQEYGEFRGGNGIVVTRPSNTDNQQQQQQPLHLDKGASSDASSYYDTFVDLYLLSMSQCLVYSKGGYGKWGSLLGFNYSCGYRFLSSTQAKRCKWAKVPTLV